MRPFDPARFVKGNTCLPCCAAASGCGCALFFGSDMSTVPPTPFGNHAAAATAITNQTSGCIAFCTFNGGDTGLSIAASFNGTTITGAVTNAVAMAALALNSSVYLSVSLKAGAVLTIPWSIATDAPATAISSSLLACSNGATVASDVVPPNAGASGIMSLTAPADGEYILVITGGGTLGLVSYANVNFTVTCSLAYWVNPAIALWNDAGTTRKLWACPKLLLPPLTESTGTWYATCADAATAISGQVSNCVGYYGSVPTGLTFTATNGGTSLSFSLSTAGPPMLGAGPFWGSVNAVGGQTLSIASTGFTSGTVDIYDDTGTLVQTLTGATPLISSALPYTGRYTVKITLSSVPSQTTATATITSSGAMSVNLIQARWNRGLVCAAALDCGNACPP